MIKNQKGQTLIEALVSLSIAVTIISAITVVVISSLNNATFTRNQNQATQYAQEGIEIVRRISLSQTSGVFNSSSGGDYCLGKDDTNLNEPLSPLDLLKNPGQGRCGFNVGTTIFSREVNISHNNAECGSDAVRQIENTKVIVRVLWSDNKCQNSSGPYCHEVVLRSCFTDYNPSKSGTL